MGVSGGRHSATLENPYHRNWIMHGKYEHPCLTYANGYTAGYSESKVIDEKLLKDLFDLSDSEHIVDCYQVIAYSELSGSFDMTHLNGSMLCVRRGRDTLQSRLDQVVEKFWSVESTQLIRSLIECDINYQTRSLTT